MKPDFEARLRKAAARRGMTVSDYVRTALDAHFDVDQPRGKKSNRRPRNDRMA